MFAVSLPRCKIFDKCCRSSQTPFLKQQNPEHFMSKQIVSTEAAPAAIGPYSQATKIDELVFTSGQIPLNPESMEIVEGGISEQTKQVMENLMAVLAAAGADASTVFKTTCFLSDMANFVAFNDVYASYFPESAPARSCVEVARLPKDVLVEVEAIAHIK